jgi:hypothetical protein
MRPAVQAATTNYWSGQCRTARAWDIDTPNKCNALGAGQISDTILLTRRIGPAAPHTSRSCGGLVDFSHLNCSDHFLFFDFLIIKFLIFYFLFFFPV